MVKEPPYRLPDDPHAGHQQQPGFDKCGKIFYFAVAILMVGIGRLIGDAHRKQRDHRRYQIQTGMGRFREDSQAAGCYSHNKLERRDHHRRHH